MYYCAFHSATDNNHLFNLMDHLYYAVYPDFGPSGGCNTGCGMGSTAFDNLTATSAHELAETMTDGQGSLTNAFAPPTGWYDAQQDAHDNGETTHFFS